MSMRSRGIVLDPRHQSCVVLWASTTSEMVKYNWNLMGIYLNDQILLPILEAQQHRLKNSSQRKSRKCPSIQDTVCNLPVFGTCGNTDLAWSGKALRVAEWPETGQFWGINRIFHLQSYPSSDCFPKCARLHVCSSTVRKHLKQCKSKRFVRVKINHLQVYGVYGIGFGNIHHSFQFIDALFIDP